MRMYDLITKKKHGEKLNREEISFIVKGYTEGEIPDYQMSSFLMAVCLKGMDIEETTNLTLSMRDSGEILDLSKIEGIKVDKHSTGGVGDKTSLVVGPMVAALGIPVAKMSGRGLGHTGGTIDKLESIPGFSTEIGTEKFFELVNKNKFAIAGQTADLAPADKKIYALRDVTATVDSIPLIASSIMSKKLASGSDVIVLDVKCGSGAFMKDIDSAIELGKTMVEIGKGAGKKTFAIVTDMSQPLGRNVGNNLEVKEAIEALKGNAPSDLMEDAVQLGTYMVYGADMAVSPKAARAMVENTIKNGTALKKFAEFVEAQGGDPEYVYNTDKFEKAKYEVPVYSEKEGYVNAIMTEEIGMTSLILGGGRETKESKIDLSVGIVLEKKLGDYVKAGEKIATLYANSKSKIKPATERFLGAYTIERQKKESGYKPVYAILSAGGDLII